MTLEENIRAILECNFTGYKDEIIDIAIKSIMSLSDIENQKIGHWISKPNIYGVVYCSECDYELHTNNTNYCPNCGAKMEGENNE